MDREHWHAINNFNPEIKIVVPLKWGIENVRAILNGKFPGEDMHAIDITRLHSEQNNQTELLEQLTTNNTRFLTSY